MSKTTPVVVVAILLLTGTASAQTTRLFLNSQPGDYIGGGIQQTITTATGGFTATQNFGGGVSIQFSSSQPGTFLFWTLDFAAPGNAPLTIGVYENATRFPFQAATEPGLDVSGDGRGCNMLTGRFEVLEVTYGTNGTVKSFAADFEQHCEGQPPALIGSIRFNSSTAIPSRCLSRVTSVVGLKDEVAALHTSPATIGLLMSAAAQVQVAIDKKAPGLARAWLTIFIWESVGFSNLRNGDPRRITFKAADGLACSASNVLTNIPTP